MNIYDIADKCGVSIATVSRVLNNNPNVSAATRARILAVMEEANYTPSALARSLGSGADNAATATTAEPLVGILCADIRDPYYADMLATLEEQLRERQLPFLLRYIGNTPAQEQQGLEAMLRHRVTAIFCVGPVLLQQANGSPITAAAQKVPVILLDGYVDAPNVYCVTCDHRRAMAQLVELLMRRQRRRILFLYGRESHSCGEKIAGYKEALASVGIPFDAALLLQVGNQLEDVNTCIKKLLVARVSFDAVIATEDILALGAQKALQRTGLNMPVIGFNNSLTARCANPELTSVDCNGAALCAAAIAQLDALTKGAPATPHTVVPTQLVERDSFRNN